MASPLGPEQTMADAQTTCVTSAVDLDATNTTSLTGTTIRKFTNARTVMLGRSLKRIASFRPVLNNMYQPRVVFNGNTWLDTSDDTSIFRGLRLFVENVGGANSYDDPGKQQRIYITCKIIVQLRGRKASGSNAVLGNENLTDVTNEPTKDEPTYDLTDTQDNLRNNLLTGAYFPIDVKGFNIGNIGHTVVDDQLIGIQFRIQSTQTYYEIHAASEGSFHADTFDPNTNE
jgi:hypothetical protein